MNRVERALLKTLLYAEIFNYALTRAQLWRFLIGTTSKMSVFDQSLVMLRNKKQIIERNGCYSLRSKTNLFELRSQREKIFLKKYDYAQKYAKWLRLIPWVWYVGISGSLAMQNASEEDDIDFFVITAPNRLWLTRFLSVLLLDILGVRRRPGMWNFKNRICLNMFVNGGALSFVKSDQNLYSAHEMTQMKTLINKYHAYERFLAANDWILQFLPQAVTLIKYKPFVLYRNRLFDGLEKITKFLQLRYMMKRRTTEVVKDTALRFHPKDARAWVMAEYKKRILHYNIS